jgi:hypothetical protein
VADQQNRAWVGRLAAAIQEAIGETINLTYVDQGYTREESAKAARACGMPCMSSVPQRSNEPGIRPEAAWSDTWMA